jgi:hypothetical protein
MATKPLGGTARQAAAGDVLIVIRMFRPLANKVLISADRLCPDEFVARSPDELSLAKGDRLVLVEKDDDFGDGWYLGRHIPNGQTGLFPEGE